MQTDLCFWSAPALSFSVPLSVLTGCPKVSEESPFEDLVKDVSSVVGLT